MAYSWPSLAICGKISCGRKKAHIVRDERDTATLRAGVEVRGYLLDRRGSKLDAVQN